MHIKKHIIAIRILVFILKPRVMIFFLTIGIASMFTVATHYLFLENR